jgi:hypothetical protein
LWFNRLFSWLPNPTRSSSSSIDWFNRSIFCYTKFSIDYIICQIQIFFFLQYIIVILFMQIHYVRYHFFY